MNNLKLVVEMLVVLIFTGLCLLAGFDGVSEEGAAGGSKRKSGN